MEYLTQKRLSNKHEAIRPLNYPRAFAWINNLIIATEDRRRRMAKARVGCLIHNQDRLGGLFILHKKKRATVSAIVLNVTSIKILSLQK